jgi:hypothetical protein
MKTRTWLLCVVRTRGYLSRIFLAGIRQGGHGNQFFGDIMKHSITIEYDIFDGCAVNISGLKSACYRFGVHCTVSPVSGSMNRFTMTISSDDIESIRCLMCSQYNRNSLAQHALFAIGDCAAPLVLTSTKVKYHVA